MGQLSRSWKEDASKEEILLAKEAQYCSWGDTVHYAKELKIFSRSEGIYVYDSHGTQYLDLQMWHSVANFGYKNEYINNIVKDQIDAFLSCPASICMKKRSSLPRRSQRILKRPLAKKAGCILISAVPPPSRTRSRSSATIPRKIPPLPSWADIMAVRLGPRR